MQRKQEVEVCSVVSGERSQLCSGICAQSRITRGDIPAAVAGGDQDKGGDKEESAERQPGGRRARQQGRGEAGEAPGDLTQANVGLFRIWKVGSSDRRRQRGRRGRGGRLGKRWRPETWTDWARAGRGVCCPGCHAHPVRWPSWRTSARTAGGSRSSGRSRRKVQYVRGIRQKFPTSKSYRNRNLILSIWRTLKKMMIKLTMKMKILEKFTSINPRIQPSHLKL